MLSGHYRLKTEWDMLRIAGHHLLSALDTLNSFERAGTHDADWMVGEDQRQGLQATLNNLREPLAALELSISLKQINHIEIVLQTSLQKSWPAETTRDLLSREIKQLQSRIQDEMTERVLFSLTAKEVEVINRGAGAFGEDVKNKFPETIEDLDEAAHCLGLSRNTACIFHLMRAMEAALCVIGKELGATIVNKHGKSLEWGVIIKNINDGLVAMPPSPKRDGWHSIMGMLYSVKECWRNSTMHPKQTYTNEEAHAVFEAVKAFMNRLAQEL